MEQQEISLQETIYSNPESSFGTAQYASTGQRFLNCLIDLIVFYIVMMVMSAVLFIALNIISENPGQLASSIFQIALFLSLFVLYVFYYAFVEGASRGRSVGKLITRTKAVREDGSEISWKDAFIRSLCRLVPFEPFSGFGSPWHDQWSYTKVISIKK